MVTKGLLKDKIKQYYENHNISEANAWKVFNYEYNEIFHSDLEVLKREHCRMYNIPFMGFPEFIEENG